MDKRRSYIYERTYMEYQNRKREDEVEYALEINNEHLADCHIRILANPKQDPAFKLVR